MRSRFFVFLLSMFLIMIPSLANAESINQVKKNILSQTEVDALLSKNFSVAPNKIRVATEEEFKAIADEALRMKKENPNQKVEVKKVLEKLNLTDIPVVKEEDFSRSSIQLYGAAAGSVGFKELSRDSTNFKAQPIMQNLLPTKIDQIAGYVSGYSMVPSALGEYVPMFNTYFSESSVPFGITNISTKKSIPHYGYSAKMVINAVVVDGKDKLPVSNTVVSKPNGSFANE